MLHSCDKAHILTAFVNSTQLINTLVHGDGDVRAKEMVFGRGPEYQFANSDLMNPIKL